jgi:hypothetical protein
MREFNVLEFYRIWGSRTVVTRVSPIVVDRGEYLERAENDQEGRTKSKASEYWSDGQVCEAGIGTVIFDLQKDLSKSIRRAIC